MAYTPPEKLPETEEELDDALAIVYLQGIEKGKEQMKEEIKTYFRQKFWGSKGRERRADPENPKTAAVLQFWGAFQLRFESGLPLEKTEPDVVDETPEEKTL